MRKVNLKQGLKALGYEVIQYHSGYNYRYGFMRKDGQLYYFNYEDLRSQKPCLLVRIADESIGLYIVEERKRCDFN